MNNILALDCSSNILSIYLKNGKDEYFSLRNIGLRHSEKLLQLIDNLMKEAELKPADLDLVCCTRGPGSFTGLRIAMATAKGISAAAGVPLVSVLTTDYLAAGAQQDQLTIPVIDAKKRRYYSGLYRNGSCVEGPLDIAPVDLAKVIAAQRLSGEQVVITGPDAQKALSELTETGLEAFGDELPVLDPLFASSRIAFMAELAVQQFNEKGPDAEGSGPLYLRKSEAEEAADRKKEK